MHFNALVPLCLLSVATSALPSLRPRQAAGYVSMPFTKKVGSKADGLSSRAITVALQNQVFYYTIDITIGTPPQPVTLVLDTGSSDIWAYDPESASSCSGCTTQYYDPSLSSTESELPDLGVFNISYGTPNSGVTGFYASDVITIGGTSVQQTIGVATVAHSGDPAGGIFGVGLSQGESIFNQGTEPYLGYIDTLYQAGLITSRAYSVYLDATTATDNSTGVIIFGGYDSSKWTGTLTAFPLVEPAPDGVYRLDIAEPAISFTLSGSTVATPPVSSSYAILLDTGTAVTRIPASQFEVIGSAVGAQIIGSGPIYSVDCSLANQAGGVTFTFSGPNGDVDIVVPWTELVITDDQLASGTCDFGLAPEAEATSGGLFIIGDTVLRSMYLLYDFDASSISLAQAYYGNAQTSDVKSL